MKDGDLPVRIRVWASPAATDITLSDGASFASILLVYALAESKRHYRLPFPLCGWYTSSLASGLCHHDAL